MAGAENHFYSGSCSVHISKFLDSMSENELSCFQITLVELKHFPETFSSSLMSRDSDISRIRISRFVVFLAEPASVEMLLGCNVREITQFDFAKLAS